MNKRDFVLIAYLKNNQNIEEFIKKINDYIKKEININNEKLIVEDLKGKNNLVIIRSKDEDIIADEFLKISSESNLFNKDIVFLIGSLNEVTLFINKNKKILDKGKNDTFIIDKDNYIIM